MCECTKGSSVGLQFTWFKDGVDVKNIAGIELKSVDRYSVLLSFSRVEPQHRGYYTCVARNNAGTNSFSGSLVVLGKFEVLVKEVNIILGRGFHSICYFIYLSLFSASVFLEKLIGYYVNVPNSLVFFRIFSRSI